MAITARQLWITNPEMLLTYFGQPWAEVYFALTNDAAMMESSGWLHIGSINIEHPELTREFLAPAAIALLHGEEQAAMKEYNEKLASIRKRMDAICLLEAPATEAPAAVRDNSQAEDIQPIEPGASE